MNDINLEAKKAKVSLGTNVWMFNYQDLGWSYTPSTDEQIQFMKTYGSQCPCLEQIRKLWVIQSKI